MKFGHDFKEALKREGFPPHWIDSAVPYRSLKKCIKNVEKELQALGLDAETLRELMDSSPDLQMLPAQPSPAKAAPVAFRYNFKDETFRPTLILYIHVKDGLAVNATLSPDTRKYLSQISARQNASPLPDLSLPEGHFEDELSGFSELTVNEPKKADDQNGMIKRVEVPLTFDAEFFGLLQDDVHSLDTLQAEEQKSLEKEIAVLSKEVTSLANPSIKAKKSDIEIWREMFEIYLQAGVFFSTNEIGGGSRSAVQAAKQLTWFQTEVVKRNLLSSFKRPASKVAMDRFTAINIKLLMNLKFQEINQLAISKILKKFDKRTSLGAKKSFPKLIQQDPFMTETMAKAVCSEVSTSVLNLVPQLDDYSCPVCTSIAYRPVRLSCGHLFCIRCMVQLQRSKTKRCPNCRMETVMAADEDNIDKATMRYMEQFFARDVKAKQKENETAAAVDQYGEEYLNAKCSVM